ncbi:mitochondrial metalloendopeptidase OMA1-like [Aegilops tauschii subsp. strangulata]|uniref:mitochondrial metalloendopeptidase OMA1-like n=1 Tax=Aegilops tauschii subsp. strangulata TaxID=200361 RepID=UPI00098A582B|nr:metalloendopeptidase OMA1, mitochondrial-like [Aegilops tauschii subsp. strangulata]
MQAPRKKEANKNDDEVACAVVLLPYAAVFIVCAALSHKETVPYTNRAHWVILSPSIERKVGEKLFEYFKKKHSKDILGPSDPSTARVHLILSDIICGIQEVFPTNSLRDDAKQGKAAARPQTGHLRDLKWEVIVMRDKSVNAYSLPGGKIVVFTGLLNVLKTDAEIAAIIAHEEQVGGRSHRNDATGCRWFRSTHRVPEVCQKLGELVGDSALNDYIGHHPLCMKRSRLLSWGDAMKEALELYCNSASKFSRGKVPMFPLRWKDLGYSYVRFTL